MKRVQAMSRVTITALFLSLALLHGCASLGPPLEKQRAQLAPPSVTVIRGICNEKNLAVNEYFGLIDRVKKEQHELVEALAKFPKGADLHNHLSGTVMPEDYMRFGTAEGHCFGADPKVKNMYTIAPAIEGKCKDDFKLLKQASEEEREKLKRSLSMYEFNDKAIRSIQEGHDHFFATFGRFEVVSHSHRNIRPMLVKLLQQAKADSVSYVETMISFQSNEVVRLADLLRQRYPDPTSYTQSRNYPAMYEYLLSEGLKDAVAAAKEDVADYVEGVKCKLKCDKTARDLACEVSFGFQAAVNRNSKQNGGSADLQKIFTQTALSFLLDEEEETVVGVNLVNVEDQEASMQGFDTQMQFFNYFHERFPQVNIAIHGGEITPCFVGDGHVALKAHVTGPIQAGAKRLGHAVSFAYLSEADQMEVVDLMKRNNTLVEIPFTSNAQILGVTGANHPFPSYFRINGIPTAFSTDDEGISYSDFTSEWIYAVSQFHLSFAEVVRLARSSIQYSFLPGEPLWQDIVSGKVVSQCSGEALGSDVPGEPCNTFINSSAKASAQWRYEAKLSDFDKKYGATLRKHLGN